MTRLEQQIQFIIEIDKMKSVFRQTYVTDGSRKENDAEHSWHFAMMIMVLSEYFENINVLKTIKMALIHDLVEIYAGDTFAYDEKGHEDKAEREEKAADKIFSLLPIEQAEEFGGLWREFELQESNEAVCAAIFDRMQPMLLNIFAEGRTWKEHDIGVGQVMKRNEIIFNRSPEIIAEYMKKKIAESVEKKYLKEK